MKKLMIAAIMAAGVFMFVNMAKAAPLPPGLANQCMASASCSATLSVDSGQTSKSCNAGGNDCTCEEISWDYTSGRCWTVNYTSCPANYTSWGTTAIGTKCCIHNTNYCFGDGVTPTTGPIDPATDVRASENAGLEEVFASTHKPMTDAYFGYVNNTNRSPTAGRGNSAKAKLDACLFSTDVDAIDALGGTDADKYGYCAGTTYGCASTMKNEYCRDSGAAVCVDRCACVYPSNGVDTCNGL